MELESGNLNLIVYSKPLRTTDAATTKTSSSIPPGADNNLVGSYNGGFRMFVITYVCTDWVEQLTAMRLNLDVLYKRLVLKEPPRRLPTQ